MEKLFEIGEVIKEISERVIMPRFKKLDKEEVKEKSNLDLVTSVDFDSEQALKKALPKFSKHKNSAVISEETLCAVDDLRNLLNESSKKDIWVIDPLDGTSNFVNGKENFAVAVALISEGKTKASWIYLPAKKQMLCGDTEQGVFLNGEKIKISNEEVKKIDANGKLVPHIDADLTLDRASSCSCSYFNAVTGKVDGVVFNKKLLPWDHIAGTFLHEQAGGYNAFIDGKKYTPLKEDGK